jgi:hypothetical protein
MNSSRQEMASLPDLMKTFGFTFHLLGYWFKDLTPIDFPVEIVLIVWPPGSGSLAHDHGFSVNASWIVPLDDRTSLKAIFHRCWGDLLRSQSAETLTGGGFHFVMPYQIHEIVNDTDEIAASVHCYFPRRG